VVVRRIANWSFAPCERDQVGSRWAPNPIGIWISASKQLVELGSLGDFALLFLSVAKHR
jgi:hypothetical protein